MNSAHYILPLARVGLKDIALAGGKNASLGEMLQHLVPLGVQVPDGFVITVKAYQYFIESNELDKVIRDRLPFLIGGTYIVYSGE